jgi:Kdo2-lipid IVA lauroyltransferase/acyltransferase
MMLFMWTLPSSCGTVAQGPEWFNRETEETVRVKHVVEYGSLRAVEAVVNRLPYRLALFAGWGLAAAASLPARPLIRRARRRMRAAFGESMTDREIRRAAWVAWRNLFFNLVESLRLHRLDKRWLDRVFDPGDALRVIKPIVEEGRGGLIAVPHMGNWELAGLACQLNEIPILVILGKQRNPLVNRYFRESRERLGIMAIERGTELMRPIVRGIRGGRFLAILPDSRMPYEDLEIPFLGGSANLGSGMALFARLTKRPIVPCLPIREGWARHRIEVLEPVPPIVTDDKAADLRAMTEAVVRQLDEGIRRHPEQWFWYNGRWVLDPVKKAAG